MFQRGLVCPSVCVCVFFFVGGAGNVPMLYQVKSLNQHHHCKPSSVATFLSINYSSGDPAFIRDGICDSVNNNSACDYDGGDCCECTCQEDLDYECGMHGNGYFCVDPDANCPKATPSPIPANTFTPSSIAADILTLSPSTTFSPSSFAVDILTQYPSTADLSSTAAPTGLLYRDCPEVGVIQFIGDGRCDDHNNNVQCGYDGGDCCPCTCGGVFGCGVNGYHCIDPDTPPDCHETESPTPAPDDTPSGGYVTSSTVSRGDTSDTSTTGQRIDLSECDGRAEYVGDGECEEYNNNEACGYDGGDCCECSCVDGLFTCGENGFDCADPEYISECPTRPTPSPAVAAVVEPDNKSSKNSTSAGTVIPITVFALIVVFSIGFIAVSTVRGRRTERAARTAAANKQRKIAPGGTEDDFNRMANEGDEEDRDDVGSETKTDAKSGYYPRIVCMTTPVQRAVMVP